MLVNQENPWTIEKWHIRAAFRRSGFWVPDHAIKMSDRTISGPNLELEKKIFLVTVTVSENKKFMRSFKYFSPVLNY